MENSTENSNSESNDIPEEFNKIITEFTQAFIDVCPEYKNDDLHEDLVDVLSGAATPSTIAAMYNFCNDVYPINIFNIMGKSDDMFSDETANTVFLPGIDFKQVWKDESISDTTKENIWKYLQLVLMTVVGNVSNMASFGDTAKMFESIDEDELKSKLQETFENMEQMFTDAENDDNASADSSDSGTSTGTGTGSGKTPFNMPDVNNIHDHLKGLMGGQLGRLAAEIAEETAQELNLDEDDHGSVKDVFQSMMKNPQKLMGIANKIGSKLETKMKSGELNEKDLMKEASEMFSKMKNTPGMGDIEKMMKSMGGMGGMGAMGGKKAKLDMNAMQQHLDRGIKLEATKERLAKKSEERRLQLIKEAEHKAWVDLQPDFIHPDLLKELEEMDNFTSGEKAQRSQRPPTGAGGGAGASKKKKKKKKGKG